MIQVIQQPPALVKFLTSIEVENSYLSSNLLDTEIDFISFYYTPNLQISKIAQDNLDFLKNGDVQLTAHDLNNQSLIRRIELSGLKRQNSSIYRIIQIIILETYAIINTMTENIENLKYLSTKDLQIVSDNINYVCDFLGDTDEYYSIIEDLRNMTIDIDYLRLQLPLLKKENDAI